MTSTNIRNYSVNISILSENLAHIYENASADYQYNGGCEVYEDSADLLPRGFGRCMVIA